MHGELVEDAEQGLAVLPGQERGRLADRRRLLRAERGAVRPEPVGQRDAAAVAAGGLDREGAGDGGDVVHDRAPRHAELAGQIGNGLVPAMDQDRCDGMLPLRRIHLLTSSLNSYLRTKEQTLPFVSMAAS